MKRAIITGIYGQDGCLLAEHLLANDYVVFGLVRKKRSDFPLAKAAQILAVDICDQAAMLDLLQNAKPDEFYHLAAAHHSSAEVSDAATKAAMLRINFHSTQVILDALLEVAPQCRFLFAGSSQMYRAGNDVTIIDEKTAYQPSSFYGVTKTASANLINLYRRQRGLWGVTAVLFNHESPRRGRQFLSRKVTNYAAEIYNAKQAGQVPSDEKLSIRDLSGRTDWSAATDIVRAIHLSLQTKIPHDYVLASGRVRSVQDLIEVAFKVVNLDWREHVVAEQRATRTPNPCLCGNPQKALEILNWEPETSFSSLIEEMVRHDCSGG